jgi:hypothetical protein
MMNAVILKGEKILVIILLKEFPRMDVIRDDFRF